jgi:hypothetical protein
MQEAAAAAAAAADEVERTASAVNPLNQTTRLFRFNLKTFKTVAVTKDAFTLQC